MRWGHRTRRALLLLGLATLLLSSLPIPADGSAPGAPTAVRAPAGPTLAGAPGHRATPLPTSTPSFLWSTATIFYGPGDPSGLLFGEGAVMAVDDRYQNTVSFGGHALNGLSAITLVYENSTNGTWWYAGSAQSPPARANATFASDPATDFAVLFGGLDDLATSATRNDTWVYYFENETWVNVTHGPSPPARENAAFAIDPVDNLGLLFGGIDPDFTSSGSTGAVVWNDTWVLNLSTFTWAPLSIPGAPGPEYGAGMVWDPAIPSFVMFGGCDQSRCTNGVWTYAPQSGAWRHPSVGGSPPSARGSAAFVWDPLDNLSLMFGGFSPGPSGPVALGGTYYLDGSASAWTPVGATGGPPATYGAASAFSDYPGCVGLWVQGGSPSLDRIITNDSVLEPLSTLHPNCFTPIGGGTGGGPPAQCSNTSAHIEVIARDAQRGVGLPGSGVTVSGACGTAHGTTGPGGVVNLTEPAPDVLTVAVDHVGYHSASQLVTYTGLPGEPVVVGLSPLPGLSARVFGRTATGTAPLPNATVSVNGALVVGRSGPGGWVNATAVPDTSPTLTVLATAVDFSAATVSVPLPYTGTVHVNLTVLTFGAFDVEVRDNLTHRPIPSATLDVAFVDPLGANTTAYTTGPDGWSNRSLQAGNYSIDASAGGYFPNRTASIVYHPWVTSTVVRIDLARIRGANVHVHVRDLTTGFPVAEATVTFGSSWTVATSTMGWANASDLGPAGALRIGVSAWGFYPNSTTVTIGPYVTLPDVEVGLAPAPPCSPYATCPATNTSAPPATLRLIPPAGPERTVLLAAPVVLAVIGGLAIAYRWRAAGARAAPAVPPSAPEATDPAAPRG
jgi:Galactose oxidase, central domain